MCPPDERVFRTDITKPNFRLGELEDRWRLNSVAWPFVQIAVTASDGLQYNLRFECSGYPDTPPTAGPWDFKANTILAFERWPRNNGGRVAAVFNSGWKSGTALYLPCDREAFAGHDHWRAEMPSKIWRPADGIIQYLELVHELLHSRDYLSPISAAA